MEPLRAQQTEPAPSSRSIGLRHSPLRWERSPVATTRTSRSDTRRFWAVCLAIFVAVTAVMLVTDDVVLQHSNAPATPSIDSSALVSRIVWLSILIWVGGIVLAAIVLRVVFRRALSPIQHATEAIEALCATCAQPKRESQSEPGDFSSVASAVEDLRQHLTDRDRNAAALIADMTHELRSPLASMRAILDADSDTYTGASYTSSTADLYTEIDRMQHLVSDLVLITAIDQPAQQQRWCDIDLDDLALHELSRLRRWSALEVDGLVEPARVVGDPRALARVLRNLVDNACRHARTRIYISTATNGQTAQLIVKNDGPAIPPSQRCRVFDRFVRLSHNDQTSGSGSGLGLSICATVVENHGGTIRADEDEQQWCTFTVSLPSSTCVLPAYPSASHGGLPAERPAGSPE